MFLSTENPPNDPPSSSNFLHLTTSSDELGQSHLPNFSIRDYAYSNRKKNFKNNWPFSSKCLQLFSSHGVTDPLPPFQNFDAVRNQSVARLPVEAACSTGKKSISYAQLKSPCSSGQRTLVKLGLAETTKGVGSSNLCLTRVENGLFPNTSVSKSEIEITTSNKNHNKKCGRMVNRGSKEDSRLATYESMASKTCPICKTFSSASNTTLNAHIDQCLPVDSVPLDSKPKRPRIKARKYKSMTDIYVTAKECTLEDLDKRNGTKWATILSYTSKVVADKSEVFNKGKKRKVSPVDFAEDAVGVGPVYIDDKGQKLRILSEFSEKKREQVEGSEKKCLSEIKGTKSFRKKRRGKKHHKYLKLIPQNSKPIMDKANNSEMPEHQRGYYGEGSSMRRSTTSRPLKTGHRRIYNQRMLAKSGLSKKLSEKGQKLYALRDQQTESDDDSWSGDPIVLKGSSTRRCTDLSATVSSPLNKQKPRKTFGTDEVVGRKSAQSRSFRGRINEKEESLGGVQPTTVRLKNSLALIKEDKHPPFVTNAWRRLSMPMSKVSASEADEARLNLSEKEDEEAGRWESEMTQELELTDDDVSGDNGETDEVLLSSNSSSSGCDDFDDDDDENNEEEDNIRESNVLGKIDDASPEFYQSDTPPSTEICDDSTTIPNEQAMYYSEEVGNMIYGQGDCEGVRFDSEVGQGSLFVEVDTIPIPGPPGSFLPSPRDMGFDENLGNSSIITSQVQSSMDQFDFADRNSSESPVSAVSNLSASRSNRMNFPAELSSFRESFSSDNPAAYSTSLMNFSGPSHGTNAETEPTSDIHTFSLHTITIDKTTTHPRFRNTDQSCCCQRKERLPESTTANHQTSHLLQRRAALNVTRLPTCLDSKTMLNNSEKPPQVIQQDLDLQSKFPSRMNLVGVPPSPSNPVLRLMGKDLMVMNQGDDEEASRASVPTTPQFQVPSKNNSCLQTFQLSSPAPATPPPLHSPSPGTSIYFNTSNYLRNSFDSTHQPQTSPAALAAVAAAQASAFRNNFDQVRYYSPS